MVFNGEWIMAANFADKCAVQAMLLRSALYMSRASLYTNRPFDRESTVPDSFACLYESVI